jgi:exonuclease SbcC
LKCDSDRLALSLVDKDFDEVRPTSNISGGESFQVSLALALGLSSMASHRVRIDTLFLDEGFGTLDSRTLQMAMQTLTNLREDGDKLVGVITNVEALKEEIDVRISVMPRGNGYSTLQGPGVCRISA